MHNDVNADSLSLIENALNQCFLFHASCILPMYCVVSKCLLDAVSLPSSNSALHLAWFYEKVQELYFYL